MDLPLYFKLNKNLTGQLLLLSFILITVSCALLLLLYTLVTKQPNGVHVEEVILLSDATEHPLSTDQLYRFNQQSKRIYCQIVTRGIFGLHLRTSMLVKWYYKTEQITSHYFQVETGRHALVWLEPPSGQMFEPGRYTIKIFIQGMLIRTVEFEITQSE